VLGLLWTAAQLLGSRVAGQATGFLAATLVARWLGPDAFGLYSFALVVATLLSQLAGTGLDLSAVRVSARHWTTRPARARAVVVMATLSKASFGLCVGAPMLVLAGPVAERLLGRPELALSLQFGAIGALLLAVTDALLAALQGRERFGQMLVVNVISAALKVGPIFIMAAVGALTLSSALLSFVGAAGATSIAGLLVVWPLLRGEVQWRHGAAGELFHFSRWLVLAVLLATVAMNLDIPTLTLVAGPQASGLYGAARTLAMPVALAAGALGAVLVPRFGRLRGSEEIGSTARHVIWRIGSAGTITAATLMAFAPLLVPLVYGSAYAGAVRLFQVLVVAYCLDLIAWPAIAAQLALDRPAVIAAMNLLFLAVAISGYLLLEPPLGAEGAAWALVAARGVVLALYLLVLWFPGLLTTAGVHKSVLAGGSGPKR
jgi:O-antigen/teichoic acid export membrane protein